MNNADLQALKDKREANIQRLDNYLKAGKTAEEKIVDKLITQIRNAEETLIAQGIELNDRINADGTFTKVSSAPIVEGKEEIIEATKVEESMENTEKVIEEVKIEKVKPSKKTVPVKKLRDNEVEKPKVSKIGVPIKETIKSKIDILSEDNNMKANDVVVDLLKRVFDGKSFTIDIEKKDKTKITSFNIPSEMEKSLNKLSKSTGAPKSEIFNRLLEESLKDFFE